MQRLRPIELLRLESERGRKRPVESDRARLADRSGCGRRVEELRQLRVGVLEVPACHCDYRQRTRIRRPQQVAAKASNLNLEVRTQNPVSCVAGSSLAPARRNSRKVSDSAHAAERGGHYREERTGEEIMGVVENAGYTESVVDHFRGFTTRRTFVVGSVSDGLAG